MAKLVANETLHAYVADRLAGTITASDGTAVPGPGRAPVATRRAAW